MELNKAIFIKKIIKISKYYFSESIKSNNSKNGRANNHLEYFTFFNVLQWNHQY